MSEIWFHAYSWGTEIKEVEVARSTENCVYLGKRRKAKTTEVEWYRPTREEAKQCLIDYWATKRDNARENWLSCEDRLSEVVKL